MKWTIVLLLVLGLLAAGLATILVNALRADELRKKIPDEILIAKTSLPAMSVISADHITTQKSPKGNLPAGYLYSPVQAIGRVLAKQIVEGQTLTESCFITSGDEAQFAAALPPGMRAISVMLPKDSVKGGVLYPGCSVDVLAAFTLSASFRSKGEAIATTLLHNIRVLAVGDETIVTKKTKLDRVPDSAAQSASNVVTVTLEVDPKQAEALQLAMKYGSVSLALRNPLDKTPLEIGGTVLSEGQLAKLGSLMDTTVSGKNVDPNSLAAIFGAIDINSPQRGASNILESQRQPRWVITVIRGAEVKEQEIPLDGQSVRD